VAGGLDFPWIFNLLGLALSNICFNHAGSLSPCRYSARKPGRILSLIKFEISPKDDEEFVYLAKKIIIGNFIECSQEKVFVVKVDNWFNHKWIGYGGGYYHLGLSHTPAKDITLPPFSKNRILSSHYYEFDENQSEYLEKNPVKDIPKYNIEIPQASRMLRKRFPEIGFVWYSSNTKEQKKGSVMAYIWTTEGPSPWYIGFTCKQLWKPYKMIGIHERELQHFISIGNKYLK
jgi:hypothetical protein